MSITSNTIEVVTIPVTGNDWAASLYSADIQGCEVLKAAEAGKCHYIKRILINTVTAMNITIGYGVSSSAPVGILFGPIPVAAGNFAWAISFAGKGLRVPKGQSLTIDGSATGAVSIYVEGKTCKEVEGN